MSDLQKRLQSGASNMAQANNLLAEAYAAIGRLESDIAGLKTGYEAYERVNAELLAELAWSENDSRYQAKEIAVLRAECEALRNNQGFSDALYEVSGLLGVTGARPEAPLVVFRQEVVPALQAVIRNSRRYEWFSSQHWYSSEICAVVDDPKLTTRLGAYCPSEKLLDDAVDAGISMSKEASQ